MSSKLLRPEEARALEPIVWPAAGQPVTMGAAPGSARPREDAAAEAARAVAEIRSLAERQVREAREAGRREGEAAARQAAEAEVRPLREQLTRSIEQIVNLRPALAAEAEPGLLKLAMAIARRILHREITLDPDALAGIVRAALERVEVREISRLRAHPAEAPGLAAALGNAGLLRGFAVEGDAALERGGIVVETSRGSLDASVETQLAEIERGLADRLRGCS